MEYLFVCENCVGYLLVELGDTSNNFLCKLLPRVRLTIFDAFLIEEKVMEDPPGALGRVLSG